MSLRFSVDPIVKGRFRERVRPPRGVWRPAKHIPGSLLFKRRQSGDESTGRNQGRSGARDAPHGDRDDRAPQSSQSTETSRPTALGSRGNFAYLVRG